MFLKGVDRMILYRRAAYGEGLTAVYGGDKMVGGKLSPLSAASRAAALEEPIPYGS